MLQSRNRDLWSEVVSVQDGKGQHEHVNRLKRDAEQSNNGKWLFGHYIETEQGSSGSSRE